MGDSAGSRMQHVIEARHATAQATGNYVATIPRLCRLFVDNLQSAGGMPYDFHPDVTTILTHAYAGL